MTTSSTPFFHVRSHQTQKITTQLRITIADHTSEPKDAMPMLIKRYVPSCLLFNKADHNSKNTLYPKVDDDIFQTNNERIKIEDTYPILFLERCGLLC